MSRFINMHKNMGNARKNGGSRHLTDANKYIFFLL